MYRRSLKIGLLTLSMIIMVVLLFAGRHGAERSHGRDLNFAKKIYPPTQEHKFVIVVPSYNNENYYEKNLQSIFSQDYSHYHVIYIDDASTDNTYQKVISFIEREGKKDKVTLIHNEINRKALHNLYTSIHSLSNEDIVVILDGDDWFYHDHVLSDLNQYYENPEVWITYGQYIRYPDQSKGVSGPVTLEFLQRAKMRSRKWQYSHLRTFYAGLFKRIRLEDLLEEGKFYATTYDLAIMCPMMEMAREHTYFTPDISYVYNYETDQNDAKLRLDEQERVEKIIRHKSPYAKLDRHPQTPFASQESDEADLIAFSYNRPMQLYALLESVQKHVSSLRKIGVVYRSDPEFERGYDIVKRAFPNVHYIEQSKDNPKADFKPHTMELVFGEFGKGADYVIFAVDDIIIKDKVDVKKGITFLEETGVLGIYYRMGTRLSRCYMENNLNQGTPDFLILGNDLFAWQFKGNKGDWAYPHSVDFILYRKKDIKPIFEEISFYHPNTLEGKWASKANLSRVGICHKEAKMINIPVNLVTDCKNAATNDFSPQELNQLFLEGWKIDINPLYQMDNIDAHMDIKPEFIPRGDTQMDPKI